MKANIKLIGLGLIGAMAFASCSQDFLDEKKNYDNVNADIYNDYDGINNLKTINDNAGVAPVKVDEKIILLLKDCTDYYDLTDGKVNVAMGSVLQLWHEARNDGINDPAHAYLPDADALTEAAKHTDPNQIIIDEAASTVYITDSKVRLDVGAIEYIHKQLVERRNAGKAVLLVSLEFQKLLY